MAKDQDTLELAIAIQALTARHEVLSIALQEALRTMNRAQADQCSAAVRARVDALAESTFLLAVPQADVASSGEMSAILDALNNHRD